MGRLSLILCLVSLLAAAPVVSADSIPYAKAGTPAPSVTLVAAGTGNITGYFLGQSASDHSVIRLLDLTTGLASNYFFPNHGTAVGTSVVFGSVNAGDLLVFELLNKSSHVTYSTVASGNPDGVNHGYVANFAGGVLGSRTYPAGTSIGFEDRAWFDYDYNDRQFLFTNLAVASTPEPGGLTLLGTGILGVAGLLRRRVFAG